MTQFRPYPCPSFSLCPCSIPIPAPAPAAAPVPAVTWLSHTAGTGMLLKKKVKSQVASGRPEASAGQQMLLAPRVSWDQHGPQEYLFASWPQSQLGSLDAAAVWIFIATDDYLSLLLTLRLHPVCVPCFWSSVFSHLLCFSLYSHAVLWYTQLYIERIIWGWTPAFSIAIFSLGVLFSFKPCLVTDNFICSGVLYPLRFNVFV